MERIYPSGDELFLVCADAPSLMREYEEFKSWGLPHKTIVVNRAGLKIPFFDYWYSWHTSELHEWHMQRRQRCSDECLLLKHEYERGTGGITCTIPIQGGSSTLDAAGMAMTQLGAKRAAVAGLALEPGYDTYRECWKNNASDIAPYIKVIDGPLVGVIGRATRQWCKDGSEG